MLPPSCSGGFCPARKPDLCTFFHFPISEIGKYPRRWLQICAPGGMPVALIHRVHSQTVREFRFGVFGGSIMSSNRSLLSLVAVLFFSTLASANSTNVATAYLHCGPFNSATGHTLTIGAKTTFAMQTATGAIGGARIGASVSGEFNYGAGTAVSITASILVPQRRYGPTCCEARSWVGSGRTPGSTEPGLPAPEPGSLMLASTGLVGIAGMLRRKLRIG
jgi:hypothetical protein